MEKVDLPVPFLTNQYGGLQPADRSNGGWNTGAANVLPSGPRDVAAELCVEGADRPIELHAASMSVPHDVYQLGPGVALATIEGVKGRSRQALERHLVFLAKRIEKSIDGPLDLATSLGRCGAFGRTGMSAPRKHDGSREREGIGEGGHTQRCCACSLRSMSAFHPLRTFTLDTQGSIEQPPRRVSREEENPLGCHGSAIGHDRSGH